MRVSKYGKVVAVGFISALSVFSLAACGQASETSTPVTGVEAQNIQKVEYEGMPAGGHVIVFDVMRPDGSVLTCSTKKDSTAGAACFPKPQR